jgi:hypothetical protein
MPSNTTSLLLRDRILSIDPRKYPAAFLKKPRIFDGLWDWFWMEINR